MDVEAGYTTTEFWMTLGSNMVTVTIGLLMVFGVPVTPEQKLQILAAMPVYLTFSAAVYMIVRSWRKNTAAKIAATTELAQSNLPSL